MPILKADNVEVLLLGSKEIAGARQGVSVLIVG